MPRTTRSNAKKNKGAPKLSAREKKLAQALHDLEFPSGNDGATLFQGCQTRDDEFKIVKKSYHAKCLKHHPDKGGDSAIFRRIHAAFALLKDLYKKKGSWLFSDVFAGDSHAATNDDDDDDDEDFDFAAYYADFAQSFGNSPPPSWEFYSEAAKEAVPLYRVELAKTARSKCSAPPSEYKKCSENLFHGKKDQCTDILPKDASQSVEKINKGEIRVGYLDEKSGTFSGWRHMRCWRVPIKVWLGFPQSESSSNEQFAAAIARMDEVLFTGFTELPHTDQQEFIEYCRNKEHWAVARTKKQKAMVNAVQAEKIKGKAAKQKKPAGKKNGKAAKADNDSKPKASTGNDTTADEEMMDAKPAAKPAPTAVASLNEKPAAASASLVRHRQQFVVPIPNRNGASDETVFQGKTFVLTGVFPEIGGGVGLNAGKDKVKALVQSFGGRCTGSISGKTDVLVVGKDPGLSKVSKARERELKLASLHDLKIGLDSGLAALEDFDFFKSEEPMKIQSFSMGYEKSTGFNGLALQASQKELAIAQGFVSPGAHKSSSKAAAKLPALETSDTAKSSAKAAPMLALPGPSSNDDQPMPDATKKKPPKKKVVAKKKKAATKEEANETKPATKKAAPKKKKVAPKEESNKSKHATKKAKAAPKKRRQALSDVSGNAASTNGDEDDAETPDTKKVPAAKKRKTTRAKAAAKEEASPEF